MSDGSPGGGLSIAAAHHAIAEAVPDRPAIAWRGRSWSWSEVADRTARLATVLADHDIGLSHAGATHQWESPHDHLALVLLNGNHYLEAMVGAWRARAAAVNINWRYTAPEMAEVLADASAAGVAYHGRYAAIVAEAIELLPRRPRLLLRVDDGTPDSAAPRSPRPRGGAGRGRRRPHPIPPGPATTATSSTPAAPPADPRASSGARTTSPPPASGSGAHRRSWPSGPAPDARCARCRSPPSCTAPPTGTPSAPGWPAGRSSSPTPPTASTRPRCSTPPSARRPPPCCWSVTPSPAPSSRSCAPIPGPSPCATS